ncbi:MAG: metallophosphoesterase [Bryobacteraceae bacterium]
MKIAVISDVHDNLWNLAAALGAIKQSGCEVLLCCGDLCSPFVMDRLREFPGPVHVVFGNNDADLFRITRKADARVQVHGEFLELTLDGKRIAVQHFDNIARPMALSGEYDLVCYGHNHRFHVTRVGGTLAVNPGPIMGAGGFSADGWQDVPATFVIYDTATGEVAASAVTALRTVVPYPFVITEGWPV